MKKILEVCISADDITQMHTNITRCRLAGVDRVELCSALSAHGITPNAEAIKTAKSAAGNTVDLLVIIRPHNRNFCYSDQELTRMASDIELAHQCGANGVVFGVLTQTGELDETATKFLVDKAKSLSLSVTFHRAFDALSDTSNAIEQLADFGIDRLLTSGQAWQSVDELKNRVARLTSLARQINGRFELVIGGGLTCENAEKFWTLRRSTPTTISLHMHSCLIDNQGTVQRDILNNLLMPETEHL